MKCKEVLAPGVWIDDNDSLHFSIPDMLKAIGLPVTEENVSVMERAIQKQAREWFGDKAKFIAQSACVNCGARGEEPHNDGCPLKS